MGNIFDLFKKIECERKDTVSNIEYLVVGLGNPGTQYLHTRHNAGFSQIDFLRRQCAAGPERAKFQALCSDVRIGGCRVLLLKPQTFMNNSGQAVAAAASYYQIPAERILVVFDDISLDVGRMRIRRNGSDGGHNGVKSILYHLESDAFPRLKIGIGKKPHPDYNLADWVLSRFTEEEEKKLSAVFEQGAQAISLIISGQIEKAMNSFNRTKD